MELARPGSGLLPFAHDDLADRLRKGRFENGTWLPRHGADGATSKGRLQCFHRIEASQAHRLYHVPELVADCLD
jgi:hypothetical protein